MATIFASNMSTLTPYSGFTINEFEASDRASDFASRIVAIAPKVATVIAEVLLFSMLAWIGMLAARSLFSRLKHLPAPEQGFFLSRLLKEPNALEMERWVDEIPNEGLIRYYGQWNNERILVATPKAARDLLTIAAYKSVKASDVRRMVTNVGGPEGLLILEGEKHKRISKAVMPALRSDEIRRAYPIMWESVHNLTNVLLDETEKKGAAQSIVTPGHFLKLTNGALIDTIASWGFSINLGAVFDVKAPIPRTYIGSLKTTKHGQQFLWWAFTLGPDFLMSLPLRPVRILNALGKFGIGTAESIVNPRIAAAEKADKDQPQPHDMLSIFMKSDKLSNHDLVHQSAHMIAGSTETTASTLGWAVHLLSRHSECQDRLREEVRAHLSPPVPAEGNRDFNDADFRELKYLDAVLKEILRFHSVNTILWRELTEQASIAGTSLPKGTRIGFSPWTSGRDPRFWGPEGRIFNPDRWLKDPIKGGASDTLAFLTFGAGPRRCPGEEYAKAQLRCIIAGVIGRFELSPFTGSTSSDVGTEVGDFSAFTLFKVMEGGLQVNVREVPGW